MLCSTYVLKATSNDNPLLGTKTFFGYNKFKDRYARELEHFYLAVIVMEPFQLHPGAGSKIYKERNRVACTTEITKRLVMFFLR